MEHDKKCDCPFHVEEDTTRVKYAAWLVIAFALVMVIMFCGCSKAARVEEVAGKWDCKKDSQAFRCENNEVICYGPMNRDGFWCHWKGEEK